MAKKPEIPTSGGSYVVRDGKLEQVEATKPSPDVHVVRDEEQVAPPIAPPAAPPKKERD